MSRKGIAAVLLLGTLTAGSALASGRGHADYVYARVVRAEPMVRYVTVQRPREECWDEVVQVVDGPRRAGVAGPAIAGGLIGGAIGRQFGSGSGRDAMTMVGALAGSAIASERAARNRPVQTTRTETRERCEVRMESFTEERVDGYLVTYQYRGRRDTIRTREHPGNRLALRVSAVPVRYR